MGDIFDLYLFFINAENDLQNDVIPYSDSIYNNNFRSLCIGIV